MKTLVMLPVLSGKYVQHVRNNNMEYTRTPPISFLIIHFTQSNGTYIYIGFTQLRYF